MNEKHANVRSAETSTPVTAGNREAVCKICGVAFRYRSKGHGRQVRLYCSRQCNGIALRSNEQWKKKLSDAKQGFIPWNKGVRMWEDRNHPRGTLGMKFPERPPISIDTRTKMSQSHKGKRKPLEQCGKNHHWWRGGVTPENVRVRCGQDYKEWRVAVFVRDGRACTRCGSTTKIHAHHLQKFADRKDLRLSVENGITLCAECHGKEHGVVFSDHALNHCKACGKAIKVGAVHCLPCQKERTANRYRCADCGKAKGRDNSTQRCRSCAAKKRAIVRKEILHA